MAVMYQPAVTGEMIDAAIRSAAGSAGSAGGVIAWTQALNLIYGDFDSVFSSAITIALQSSPPVMYTPPPSYSMGPLGIAPVVMMTSALATASAALIDSTIKAQCSSMSGAAASGAGAIAWTIVCKQIGLDLMMNINSGVPPAVWSPCAGAYSTAASLLAASLGGAISSLGPQIDAAIKSAASSGGSSGGTIAWTQALGILMPYIKMNVDAAITTFSTAAIPL